MRAPSRPFFSFVRPLAAVVLAGALLGLSLPASAQQARASGQPPGTAVSENLDLLGRPVALPDIDGPEVGRAPTAAQLRAVRDLHAHAGWSRYGTVDSLI